MRENLFLQSAPSRLRTIVRIHRYTVVKRWLSVRCDGFFSEGISHNGDVLLPVRGRNCDREIPAVVSSQPEQTVCRFFGKRRSPAVCVQEYHAQPIGGSCRKQGGLRIPQPFVQHGCDIRLCDQSFSLCHADAFQKLNGVRALKTGIQIRVQQLAGRGKSLRKEQILYVRKCAAAIGAEEFRVPDEYAASLCRLTIAQRFRRGESARGKRLFFAECLRIERQFL